MVSRPLLRGVFILVVIGMSSQMGYAQTFQLDKTVDTTTPQPGEIFNYIINATCNSSTQDCESAVITDPLPANLDFVSYSQPLPAGVLSLGYDAATHSISFTFDATACPSCNPDGLNTDEDDFAQGATVQLVIQVRFPFQAFSGTSAINEVVGTSNNAGNPISTAATVTATGGTPPQTGCDQLFAYHNTPSDVSLTDDYWISLSISNAGLSDINNWMSITEFPNDVIFDYFVTPEMPTKNQIGSVYYERSDMIGSWIHWTDFNFNTSQQINKNTLGLPAGVEVTSLRVDAGTLEGDGCWNPFQIGWPESFRMYFDLDASVMNGDIINSCTDFTGTINGVSCADSDCNDTEVGAGDLFISAGKSPRNLSGSYQFAHDQGDEMIFRFSYSSPPTNTDPIVGAVIVDILPVGMTYVSHAITSGSANIQNQVPVLELETLSDGRQLVRFVWAASLGNEFTLNPTGAWIGFALEMVVKIDENMTPATYTNDLYYSSTGSDHNCFWGGQTPDTEDYLNGYGYDGMWCFGSTWFEVLYVPPPAGLDASKESIGSTDSQFSSFPDYGTTVPGGISNYKITLSNPNATPIDELVIIDVFPYMGDTEVLNNSVPRNSDWRPVLVEPIMAPPGTTVYYSTANNPCRDELAGINPTPFPTGCTPAAWTITPPSDLSTVTAVKLDLGNTVLNQGDIWELTWEMRAPLNGVNVGTMAWNSFGYIGTNADLGVALLPSEPIKVGIDMTTASGPSIGDFVWEDLDKNGLQDSGEPGIDGVRVNLYADSNNNGIAEPGVDALYTFTLTSLGGQYLFTDFPEGDYFLEFLDYPSGYFPTYSHIGSDPLVDSEPSVTDIFFVSSSTDNPGLDFGLVDEVLPQLVDISGRVYEDINYGGGDGRSYNEADASAQSSGWSADDIGVENAVVELYDSAGNFISSTLSDANGLYTFSNIADGTYQIRLVNHSVGSNRNSNSTNKTIVPVQTFRTDGTIDIINEIGGVNPALVDAATNTTGSNLSSLNSSSVVVQSLTTIVTNGSTVTGVDFGYNFDTVVNTNDSDQGSLRQFLINNNELANDKLDQEDNPTNGVSFPKDPEWETSIFVIPGASVHTIQPLSELEVIRDPKTHLSAYTQAGSAQGPITNRTIAVEIVGNTNLYEGVEIFSSDVQVSGLAVTDFRNSIYSTQNNSTNNFIWGNYVGTAADGVSIASSFSGQGIFLFNVNDSYVGTNGDNNNDSNEGNLVSNSFDGITLRSTSNVLIAGNFVGIDQSGTVDIGNRFKGIHLRDPDGPNVVGFDDNLPNTNAADYRNVSSGNGNDGVRVLNGDNQVIAGNYFGTDLTGTVSIKNINFGVQIQGNVNNLIVGTDSDGDDDIKERNLISGNATGMRFLVGSTGSNNRISGNFIGTDVSGNAALPNERNGLEINGPISGVIVGTNADTVNDEIEGNVISGNGDDGIRLTGTNDNIIAGNNIGVAYDDASPLPNGKRGIFVATTSANTTIGYAPAMANSNELIVGNDIKHNADVGVALAGIGTSNRISRNQMDSNGQLGIDIDYDGVTPNDDGDPDSGPNDWFNFPVLEYARIVGDELHICGFAPAGSEIEFFISDGGVSPSPLPGTYTTSFGEGALYLFTAYEGGPLDVDNSVDTYTNDGTGATSTKTQNRIFIKRNIAGLPLTQGSEITATATNSSNSTSEFSGWTNLEIIEICNDGIDNDMDGLTDCEDTDCELIIADPGPIITFCEGIDGIIEALVDAETLSASIQSCEDPSTTSSSGGSIGYSISWSGPNGFTSDIINPTVTEPGIYTLTVTDDNGCETTAEAEVLVFECDESTNCFFQDDFSTLNYFNSSGTLNWANLSWDEQGDNNNMNSGDIYINSGLLYLEHNDSTLPSIQRSVDLSLHSSAILYFDFFGAGDLDADDVFYVEVYDGTSWITVFTFRGPFSTVQSPWIDITNYISADTEIRFGISSGFSDSGENLILDNVTIYVDCVCDGIADAGIDVEICDGETVTLAGLGGVEFLWSPAIGLSDPTIASPEADPTETTTYTLTVTDEFGCTDTDEVTVTVYEGLNADVVGISHDLCEDGSGEATISILNGTGPFTINWETTDGEEPGSDTLTEAGSIIVTGLNGGTTYCFSIVDANGCTLSP